MFSLNEGPDGPFLSVDSGQFREYYLKCAKTAKNKTVAIFGFYLVVHIKHRKTKAGK
jgi:hypothetical protein